MRQLLQQLPAAIALVCALLLGHVPALAVQTDAPPPANQTGARAETVATGLVNPWGLAFLPNGDMLVTERPGRIRYITASGDVSPAMKGAPDAWATGQGGMLDISLAPPSPKTARATSASPAAAMAAPTAPALPA